MFPFQVANVAYFRSPEVLSALLNAANFDEFKMSDVYSFSLVVWEICCRIQVFIFVWQQIAKARASLELLIYAARAATQAARQLFKQQRHREHKRQLCAALSANLRAAQIVGNAASVARDF